MHVLIRNFQSIQLVDFEVNGLTVIVGPSNLGKSAVIRAISSAFYNRLGDDFVRRGTNSAEVAIVGAPKVGGGSIDIEWHKGKGVNYFLIDGAKYDKVARDTPVHLPQAGYKEIQIGDEYIRPQISEQFDRMFLLDRSGSFVHDVIAQASRLSVLLRADKSCGSDLKRQKQLKGIRQSDLEKAGAALEAMAPIKDLYARVQDLKPKVLNLKSLVRKLDDLKAMGEARATVLPLTSLKLGIKTEWDESIGERVLEVQKLVKERNMYKALPSEVPSAKAYDFDGMARLADQIPVAAQLGKERVSALKDYRESQSALRSITTELEMSEADLSSALSNLNVCPVCERVMPGKEVTA